MARTAEKTADLTNRMLQPRLVDTDFMWGMFITNRSFLAGGWTVPDLEYPAQMLEMWHSGNACYSMLDTEVAKLGAENSLPPLEFILYVNHLTSLLSPCVQDQLPLVDSQRFFDNSPDVRTELITMWFDRTWQDANDETFLFEADCMPEFYSHLPVAIAATEASDLEHAWVSAMVVVSGCAREAMGNYFAFLDLPESQLFTLQPDDRYTTVSLQMTMLGHLISIDQGKPHEECWPDYESRIAEVATASSLEQLTASRDAAFRTLYACLEGLPATNPFAGQ